MNKSIRNGVVVVLLESSLVAGYRTSIAGLSSASSRRLADTVAGGSMPSQSSCTGTIDLTKATGSQLSISATELNALIADNGGNLVLVVDVNGANGGLETSRAQGSRSTAPRSSSAARRIRPRASTRSPPRPRRRTR